MYILLVLLIVVIIALTYALINILIKYEKLEDDIADIDTYIVTLYSDLTLVYNRIKKLDRLGSFESDDETGFIYEQIKKSITNIEQKYSEINTTDGSETKE